MRRLTSTNRFTIHPEFLMSTIYRLSYCYMDYSHQECIEISTDKDSIIESYQSFISNTLEDDDEDAEIDYVCIEDEDENIIFEYDFNG